MESHVLIYSHFFLFLISYLYLKLGDKKKVAEDWANNMMPLL